MNGTDNIGLRATTKSPTTSAIPVEMAPLRQEVAFETLKLAVAEDLRQESNDTLRRELDAIDRDSFAFGTKK